jgi:excisionase family DNA binding protein
MTDVMTEKAEGLEPLYSPAEVARFVGLSPVTLRQRVRRGLIRAVRPASARAVRIPESELRRLIAESVPALAASGPGDAKEEHA